jgi:hypothetical protein
VVLTYDGKGLSVVDERSANGTRVRRVRPDGDQLLPLYHGTVWTLRQGDSVVLHDRLELLPSGRRFVFEEDTTDGTVGPPGGDGGAGPTMPSVPMDWYGQDQEKHGGHGRHGDPGGPGHDDGPHGPYEQS